MLPKYSHRRVLLPALVVVTALLLFVQQGSAATTYNVLVSDFPGRSAPVLLDGQTVSGNVFVFTGPDSGVSRVSFYVDNPGMSGSADRIENIAPYDLAGGSVSTAIPYDTNQLSDGPHSITVKILLTTGSTEIVTANFSVANTTPALNFDASSISIPVESGASNSAVVDITSSDGGSDSFSLSSSAAWLIPTAAASSTTTSVTITADAGALSAGTYSATVTASSPSATSASLSVTVVVSDPPPPTSEEALQFNISALSYALDEGEMGVALVDLITSDGAPVAFGIVDDASWISVVPDTGVTAEVLKVSIDATGLAAGVHSATVTATAAGYVDATLSVSVDVTSTTPVFEFNLNSLAFTLAGGATASAHAAFTSSDGSQPAYTLTDNAAWLSASSNVTPTQTDLMLTIDASGLTTGSYSATLNVDASGYISDSLTVNLLVNEAQSVTYSLVSSGSPDRSSPVGLNGLTLSDAMHIFVDPEIGIGSVEFYLDDPAMTGIPFRVEGIAPFDFNSENPDGTANGFDTTTLANGAHNISAAITLQDSSTVTLSADFTVDNVTVVTGLPYFAGDSNIDTAVSIVGEKFLVNGTPTYSGLSWNGNSIEGLLLNSRMVNGIYDDMDGSPPASMSPWDARANTDDFIANMQDWRDRGLNAIVLNMQGGCQCSVGIEGDNQIAQVNNNPFGSSGTQAFDDWNAGLSTPHSRYLQRLGSIIRQADDLGMTVMLGLFYFGQDEGLADEQAVVDAVDATADWIIDNGWTNVIIEINNEAIIEGNTRYYQHDNLQVETVDALIARVQQHCNSSGADCSHLPAGRLLASTSLGGGSVPSNQLIAASDFVLLHGNGQNAQDISNMVAAVRSSTPFQAQPRPIVFNEDSTDMANFDAALASGASWGYYDDDGYQTLYPTTDPNRWGVVKATSSWWSQLAVVTGNEASTQYYLALSLNPDRSNSVGLSGANVSGNIYVFSLPEADVTRVSFFIDDITMSGSPTRTEGVAPFDMAGTEADFSAAPYNTSTLSNGLHTVTARITKASNEIEIVTATFTVNN